VTAPSSSLASLPEPDRLRELIARYDKPGPRYTSYPTAPVWSDDFGEEDFRRALRRVGPAEVSIYIHVPYCERLCSFCACNRKITRDHSVVVPYLEGLDREAGILASEIGAGARAVQLAIGGGSPNFLSAPELARLSEIVDSHFPPTPDAERSIELDPRNTKNEQIDALVQHGFNRVSLGVQDTSPRVQHAINRIQSDEQVEQLVSSSRRAGVESVNFDLIYGLPFQTVESYSDTLDRTLAMRPDRIALYSYAHVTWISKAQRGFEKKDLPSAPEKVDIFLLALDRLQAAGYRYLGLDHFALPEDELAQAADRGELRRNFMGYTLQPGVDLLALGPSGISELAETYAQSARDPDDWAQTLGAGQLATLRGWSLSPDDLRRRWLIQQTMCQAEISASAYRARFDESLEERIPDLESRLAPFVEDGLLEPRLDGYAVTAVGRLFLRVIAMAFDAYLTANEPGRPRFSRTL
jgi:oxygen-independent coproporphyrinogen-3 oxidase